MNFDPVDFVNKLCEKLVLEFEHASVAGTPGLVGSARENPARKQLEKLLPTFVSTGSGILIDSYGGRSTQQDLVFFERDFCPVYSVNDTPEATYFPVEGIVAVGEVKSMVDKDILFDALRKIGSAKRLKRFSQKTPNPRTPDTASYRPFGSRLALAATPSDEYDQGSKFRDQVFGFVLCKKFKHRPETVLDNMCEFGSEHGTHEMPNIVVSLNDGFIQSASIPDRVQQHSPLTGNSWAFIPDKPRALTFLVNELRQHAWEGRSVPLHAFDRYMSPADGALPNAIFYPFR